MNKNILKALTWDAIYQVLDNWVFRILTVLTLLPVLFTFLVGFREDEIVLLFGLKTWSYESLFSLLPGDTPALSTLDGQSIVITVLIELIVTFLLGNLGIMFCIAATAFFVPRMIEKGAADLLFHKPVSRLTLYLSRYFAGLFFIAVVSCVLVVGLYLGFLVSSQYNDPGILFAALTLIYIFGLVHTVSMLIGVVTRSTVASILLSMMFFTFNGCVHAGWVGMQQNEASVQEMLAQRNEGALDADSEDEADAEESSPSGDEHDQEQERSDSLIVSLFKNSVSAMHYVLPKTSDADVLASKLRRSAITKPFQDPDSLVTLFKLPSGAELLEDGWADLRPSEVPEEELGQPLMALRFAEADATFVLSRRPLRTEEVKVGSRTRVREESALRAAKALEKLLEGQELRGLGRLSQRFGSNTDGLTMSAVQVYWTGNSDQGDRTRAVLLFKGVGDDWFLNLTLDAPAGELTEERMLELYGLVDRGMALDNNPQKKTAWYEDKLSFDAGWRFNILFSVGSSLAFGLLMLALGNWRLKRIDF